MRLQFFYQRLSARQSQFVDLILACRRRNTMHKATLLRRNLEMRRLDLIMVIRQGGHYALKVEEEASRVGYWMYMVWLLLRCLMGYGRYVLCGVFDCE